MDPDPSRSICADMARNGLVSAGAVCMPFSAVNSDFHLSGLTPGRRTRR